jgi:hypothetical protein
MAMVRKQVYIDQALNKKLKREAKQRGVSEAEVIRERLSLDCVHITTSPEREKARKEFLALLEQQRQKALKVIAEGRVQHVKFNREEAYEERLERQMPR